jgi:hypothetical protein
MQQATWWAWARENVAHLGCAGRSGQVDLMAGQSFWLNKIGIGVISQHPSAQFHSPSLPSLLRHARPIDARRLVSEARKTTAPPWALLIGARAHWRVDTPLSRDSSVGPYSRGSSQNRSGRGSSSHGNHRGSQAHRDERWLGIYPHDVWIHP